jgi:hypothetical protein
MAPADVTAHDAPSCDASPTQAGLVIREVDEGPPVAPTLEQLMTWARTHLPAVA